MRLYEIAQDDKKIRQLFRKYFRYDIKNLSINNGIISFIGSIRMFENNDNIPIKFNEISESFWCDSVELISLDGSPNLIGGEFNCANNNLTSLIGGPKNVRLDYFCFNNPLTSLDGLPTHVGKDFYISYSPNLPLLKLLNVNGLNRILFVKIIGDNYSDSTNLHYSDLSTIMNKYIGQGRKGAIQCAAELTKAGFKGNAKL